MAHDVFVSYSTKNKKVAEQVCQALESAGIRCWIAPRDIPKGAIFAEEIASAIEACQVFVLVFTSEANASKYVFRELEYTFNNDKVIIAFRVEECEPAKRFKFYLNSLQWLNALIPPVEAYFPELIEVVRSRLSESPMTAAKPASQSPEVAAEPRIDRSAKTATKTLIKKPVASRKSTQASQPTVANTAEQHSEPAILPGWLKGLLPKPVVENPTELSSEPDKPSKASGEPKIPQSKIDPQPQPEHGITPRVEHSLALHPTPLSEPAAGATRVREKDGMVEVYVPAGEFLMGSNRYNEMRQHKVYLDGYWIDRTPVTNAMFARFAAANPTYRTRAEIVGWGLFTNKSLKVTREVQGVDWRHPQGPGSSLDGLENHPVVLVSWDDASAYCNWVGARLPTEAQWEKAARGTNGRAYPWGNSVPGLHAYFNNLLESTSPVGSYPAGASPFGVLDMVCSVWQWCADWFDEEYYQNSPSKNPTGPESGSSRVIRGGDYDSTLFYFRATYRGRGSQDSTWDKQGFRCLRCLPVY